jgi:hypothetical protein
MPMLPTAGSLCFKPIAFAVTSAATCADCKYNPAQGVPLLPTVGCQLGVQRGAPQDASNPLELYKAMNNTSRHIGDYEFVNQNPMYELLVEVRMYVYMHNVHVEANRAG